jgi:predicted amidohydrolase
MVREVKLIGIQMLCDPVDIKSNLARMSNWIDKVSSSEPDIVCFPELSACGYNPEIIGDKYSHLSDSIPGYITEYMRKKSEEYNLYIILGLVEHDDKARKLYNSTVILNPEGSIEGVYRKTHLLGLEKKFFTPGDIYPVFQTVFGKIGIMICYDAGFPEVARILALKGAEIIFLPSAWRFEDKNTWDINTRSRALENSLFLLGVNRVGIEGKLHLFGNSRLINPRGDIIVNAQTDVETSISMSIDLNSIKDYKGYYQYLDDRRPETYTNLCK